MLYFFKVKIECEDYLYYYKFSQKCFVKKHASKKGLSSLRES